MDVCYAGSEVGVSGLDYNMTLSIRYVVHNPRPNIVPSYP